MKYYTVKHRFPRHLLTIPFIYLALVPIVIMDIYIEIYHRFTFPFYGIPYIKRGKYVRIDRQKLSYLNPLQKIYCMYCGYANGVLQYWVKIFGDTENFWCAIKHNEDEDFVPPAHHKDFIGYDNEEEFVETYKSKRTPLF